MCIHINVDIVLLNPPNNRNDWPHYSDPALFDGCCGTTTIEIISFLLQNKKQIQIKNKNIYFGKGLVRVTNPCQPFPLPTLTKQSPDPSSPQ